MLIELPYNAKVLVESKNNTTKIEIEESYSQGINALLQGYNNSNGFANQETIEEFFELHEDQLQQWLSSRGYIFNKA